MRSLRSSALSSLFAVLCGCGAPGHTDRDGPTPDPAGNAGSTGAGGSGGATSQVTPLPRPDKVDLLFMLDNSRSMDVKHQLFADAAKQLVQRLRSEVGDLHLAVITSSLGDGGDGQVCPDPEDQDMAHVLGSTARGAVDSMNSEGFLEWHEGDDAGVFERDLERTIAAVGQKGCGYEASLEAWVRFLVDPTPYQKLARVPCDASDTATNCIAPATDDAGHVLLDQTVLEQRAAFLRPDSLLMIVSLSDENDCSIRIGGDSWKVSLLRDRMSRAASACASDPNSACCYACGSTPPAGCSPDPSCETQPLLTTPEDSLNLRCEEQKRRFGADFLYPIERYVRALTAPKLCASQPSFDPASCPEETIDNPLFAGGRPADFISYTSIVGVPWQDLVSAGADAGQLTTFRQVADLKSDDWDQLLGKPHASPPVPPADPHMQESMVARAGVEPGNAINGRDFDTSEIGFPDAPGDLEYACIFPLAQPIDCAQRNPALDDCDCYERVNDTPLCEQTPGVSPFGSTQYHSKAYPGLRHLELLQGVNRQGGNVTLGSICAPNTTRDTEPGFGYRPTVSALFESLRPILGAR